MNTLANPIHPETISIIGPRRKWTERELLALPSDDGKYELIDGDLVLMSPAAFSHGEISVRISYYLGAYVFPKKLGSVLDGQTGYWMKSGNLLSPDVSFVSNATFAALERRITGFFNGSPDLAVEVTSPSERSTRINGKIADYFESGTKLVWIVRAKTKSVRVYHQPGISTLLGAADKLDGGNVLPGFELALNDIFPDH